jgi:hypothetical protein
MAQRSDAFNTRLLTMPATHIRALDKHNQQNAINPLDYVIKKFPFRIQTVRTVNGHESQANFHWHVADQGIRHVYIKPGTPDSMDKSNALIELTRESFINSFLTQETSI